jgi:hypothetical protein
MDFPVVIPKLTADAVCERLKKQNDRIIADLKFEGKDPADWVPAWYVHLPSGEKAHFRLIGVEGPLIRFTTFDGRFIILSPQSVVVTIEPQPEDSEGFPAEWVEWEEPNEEDSGD